MIRKKLSKSLLSFLISLGIISTGFMQAPVTAQAASSNDYGLQDNIADGTILHCFDWTYQQIIDELPNIAAAGFTSVQTSPAQAANTSDSIWYYLYQPSGFYVGDAGLGSADDLQRLCSEADNYGIKVIVDVVANHLAGDHTYIDDSLKASEYWHNCSGSISYSDRYQVTHYDIGMPDLNSENSYVQYKVANYISELKSYGVDGIRWDAAKHISLPSESCGFWSAVIDSSMFNYGEILDTPVTDNTSYANYLMCEYTDYMSVSDSVYSAVVTGSIKDGTVPSAYGSWTLVDGVDDNEVVYFAESHDTYSNTVAEGSWTKYLDQNIIDRSYAILASKANSTALYFSRPYATEKTDIKIGSKGSTHFTSPEVAAVNKLHNQCAGESEYYSTSDNVAIVARETGATLVLGSGSNQNVSVSNPGSQLEEGTYTDAVNGGSFVVTSSTISGYIGSTGIAVLLKENSSNDNGSDNDDSDNNDSDSITVYFSNNYNWNSVYSYTWKDNVGTTSWPGTQMTYVKQNEYNEAVYKIEIPADIDGLIFSDGNGNQTIDITSNLNDGTGFYISGSSNGKYTVGCYEYVE